MTLNEVQLAMEEFNRYVDDRTQILFGTSVDPKLAGRLTVTIFGSLGQDDEREHLPEKVTAVRKAEIPPVVATPAPLEEPTEVADLPLAIDNAPEAEEGAELDSLEVVAQTCLFGDQPDATTQAEGAEESQDETPLTGVDAARARLFSSSTNRVSRPVPGRSLQSSSSFLRSQTRQETAPEVEPGEPIEDTVHAVSEPLAQEAFDPQEDPRAVEEAPVEIKAPEPKSTAPEYPERAEEPPLRKPGAKAPQQETLKFEPVTRGRFEKSEPTIVDGQDLDVPTYLRRNIRVRP